MQNLARMLTGEIDGLLDGDIRRVQRQRSNDGPSACAQRIVDISRFGCQVESSGISDGCNGQFVEIDFGGALVIRAIIRWADHARLGLEFTRPLGSAQVDRLMEQPTRVRLRRL